jgi:hypothetical protein
MIIRYDRAVGSPKVMPVVYDHEPAWEVTRDLKTGRIVWDVTNQNIDALHEVPSYAIVKIIELGNKRRGISNDS